MIFIQKKIVIAILCILLIFILILISGCFGWESKKITSMDAGINIDYNNIALINYTYAKQELEKKRV